MNPVFFFVYQAPYYDEKVTKEGDDSKNPNADLKRVVLHEIVAAREFINGGIAFHSID